MLTVSGFNVSFPVEGDSASKTVLCDIEYTLDKQNVVYIIGESGSGKTMLAQSIAGLLPQNAVTRGSMSLDGIVLPHKLTEKSTFRGTTIGYIFQDYLGSFSPVRTIEWHYQDILDLKGIPKSEHVALIKDIFKKLGFTDYHKTAQSYPHQLSGGQLQRLQIGMVMLQKPRIILADEITTALDAHIQNEIIKLTTDVAAGIGAKLVFITHDFRLVNTATRGSEVIVMYGGRVMEILSDITHYHHPYTRLLLSCVPQFGTDSVVDTSACVLPADENIVDPACPFAPRCPNRLDICVREFPLVVVKDSRYYCHNPV